jgi:pimeloyl-ACP methyl ester carboxylesterase
MEKRHSKRLQNKVYYIYMKNTYFIGLLLLVWASAWGRSERAGLESPAKKDNSPGGLRRQDGLSSSYIPGRFDGILRSRRPQEPNRPYPYIEEWVSYDNVQAKVRLAGTLTLPASGKPAPAVILITGSGAQNRNYNLYGHPYFFILADYLTRKGIAVLRVDDRGVGDSTGDLMKSTCKDLADDVIAGLKYLRTRRDIDPNQIGLIGHSEGAIVASIAAMHSPAVTFIVLLSGPGLAGRENMYLQSELMLKTAGVSDNALAMQHAYLEQTFEILRKQQTGSSAEKKIRDVIDNTIGTLSQTDKSIMGLTDITISKRIQAMLSPWFRYIAGFDPGISLRRVKCPVLAINGQLDVQIPPKTNLSAIEQALKAAGNSSYTIRELPMHNHLLQRAGTGAVWEYAVIEEAISPVALELISQWISAQVKLKAENG